MSVWLTETKRRIAMSFIETAFQEICLDSKKPKTWYVTLCVNERCYGGPEEGGWWYDRAAVLEYKSFPDEDTAAAVADRVRERAAELSLEAERVHGEACLSSLDWLEARGLEPDYLPEPNGPEEYFVMVTESVPSFSVGKPTYE
jgi:hypothetical protein